MLDVVDSDLDHVISDFVVRMHRYRNPKEQDGDVLPMGSNYTDMLSTFRLDAEDGVGLTGVLCRVYLPIFAFCIICTTILFLILIYDKLQNLHNRHLLNYKNKMNQTHV